MTAEKNATNPRAFQRQEFCMATFVSVDETGNRAPRWFDCVCLLQMTKRRVARVELIDRGSLDHFAALEIRILHQENGEIDRKVFEFRDWLKTREDSRRDIEANFHVWAHGATFDWYIARPSTDDIFELMHAIELYIARFEE